jgi:phage terminase large subunit-like protein
VLASDDSKQGGKKQGLNPTLALIDELHAHENDNLYVDMRSGLFKRDGLLVDDHHGRLGP